MPEIGRITSDRARQALSHGLFVFFVFTLAACGGSGDSATSTSTTPTTAAVTTSTTVATTTTTAATASSTAPEPTTSTTAVAEMDPEATAAATALLELDDLPAGWQVRALPAVIQSDQLGAFLLACGETIEADLDVEDFGVVVSHGEPESLTNLNHSIRVHNTEVAAEIMRRTADAVASCSTTWEQQPSPGEVYELAVVEPPIISERGDGTTVYATSLRPLEGGGEPAAASIVQIRCGGVISRLAITAFEGAELGDAVIDDLAGRAFERLSEYVEGTENECGDGGVGGSDTGAGDESALALDELLTVRYMESGVDVTQNNEDAASVALFLHDVVIPAMLAENAQLIEERGLRVDVQLVVGIGGDSTLVIDDGLALIKIPQDLFTTWNDGSETDLELELLRLVNALVDGLNT